jgi:dihydropteroate synthase
MIWNCGRYSFDTRTPVIMGILNLTPDSFSDGGTFFDAEGKLDRNAAVAAARTMADEGALIIDVGGESTRPGADPVSVEEERDRVLEVVHRLAGEGICVSIDTRHAEVARAAVRAGAAIINDVTGFRDPEMVKLATECNAGLVVVHMQGDEPKTMQEGLTEGDIVDDVVSYLAERAKELEAAGVARERLCLDPSPGFGKTPKQTVRLMRNFHELIHLGYPTMVAASRKSYVGYAYKIDDPSARDDASAAEAVMACELGAFVVRCHNVALHKKALEENLRPYCLVGMGCNVPLVADEGEELEGKKAMLLQAINEMCLMPDTQLVDFSSFYESEPAYLEDQDTFVNAVALFRTGLPPQEVLKCLQAIENSLGRVRTVKNGPRTCDLDILDYQGYVSDLEVLTLPHPLLTERDFVVKPLLEIMPNHVLADGTPVTLDTVTVGKARKC